MATTEVKEDVDGGPPGGRCRQVQQRPPPRLKKTSIAGPLGALSAGLAIATTEDKEDIDGRPPGGRCQWVWQRPLLRLKKTSMVGPLGGVASGFGSGCH
jgi:hypothetical protein